MGVEEIISGFSRIFEKTIKFIEWQPAVAGTPGVREKL